MNGERIAMRLYGSQAGWYYFVNDHLGTPQKIVDASGSVVWQAAYLPFGKAQVLSGSVITNNFRFPGQYYDAETELHYNWHRYYMPAKGRYLTGDPIGLAGGINLYAYVRGNPVRGAGPEGLISVWDLADPVFFAISLRNFKKNPGWGTGFELSLDTISLLPVIPSVGWITKADDAAKAVKKAKSVGGGSCKAASKASKNVRARHHTSPEGLKGIKNDAAINPARGEPVGVHVEVEPFGPANTASAETGAFGKGAYVEFDAPSNMVKTKVGPRNTAVIPSGKPLSIKKLNPAFKKSSWWKFWE